MIYLLIFIVVLQIVHFLLFLLFWLFVANEGQCWSAKWEMFRGEWNAHLPTVYQWFKTLAKLAKQKEKEE